MHVLGGVFRLLRFWRLFHLPYFAPLFAILTFLLSFWGFYIPPHILEPVC